MVSFVEAIELLFFQYYNNNVVFRQIITSGDVSDYERKYRKIKNGTGSLYYI